MTFTSITPPLAEPITLAETKAHLKIDHDAEDALLGLLIRTAREHLERDLAIYLIEQELRLYLDEWPERGTLEILRGPIKAISEIRVFNEVGDAEIVSLDGHVLDGMSRPARLRLPDRLVPRRAINGIEIDFVAGFGQSGTDVPDGIKRALLMHVALMHALRGGISPDQQPAAIPFGYDALTAPYRIRRI